MSSCVQAGDYLKLLMLNVSESKWKCYVDADLVETIHAATGDCVLSRSLAATTDLMTASGDAEEVPDDDSFQLC